MKGGFKVMVPGFAFVFFYLTLSLALPSEDSLS